MRSIRVFVLERERAIDCSTQRERITALRTLNVDWHCFFLSDSVCVLITTELYLQAGPVTVLTTNKKKLKNIGIFLKDDNDEDNEPEKPSEEINPEMFGRGKRSAVLENKLRVSRFLLSSPL